MEREQLFCPGCLPYFEMLHAQERCVRCFGEHEGGGTCPTCRAQKGRPLKVAALFERVGATQFFVEALEGERPDLMETASALLFLMVEQQKWRPDLVTTFPLPLFERVLQRRSKGLGKAVAERLGKPFVSLLTSRFSSEGEEFVLKREELVVEKRVLVVGPTLTPSGRWDRLATALHIGSPLEVYGLALIL